jgi:soluble lytic murein transglycosylase-like protein
VTLVRWLLRTLWRLPLRLQLMLAVCAPLAALNGAVAFFGSSLVFPLSPFSLKEKAQALQQYARHRPGCLLHGHPDLDALAAAAERAHGLPPGLLRALVAVESGGNAHRISPAGAMGPAQLMPGTARLLEVKDPFDPEESLDAGARYLAQLILRMGDVRLGVAAYNAGPGAVHGAVPRNGETEFYVAKVMRRFAAR